ncbi:DUF2859 domain-containing protein [Photobacterium leiognathi]|uniref:DUF2859 domain-containing protein n=1 Tax=Photobacterium leiognathi TaxID=553611 RepID=UPI0029818522|nr:DUF2859 domain-containing protein [Photobacterium leiognathi]
MSLTCLLLGMPLYANALTELPTGQLKTQTLVEAMGQDRITEAQNVIRSQNMSDIAKKANLDKHVKADKQKLMDDAVAAIFPVVTPSMKPKSGMTYTKLEKPLDGLAGELAVIGSDPYSLQWLNANIQRFKRNNVAIMLVDVQTDQQYKRILEQAQGLYVIPVSGQQIHSDVGLDYYPAYITGMGYGQ